VIRIGAIRFKFDRCTPVAKGVVVFQFVVEDGKHILALFRRVEDVMVRCFITEYRFERMR